ncbi:hypothetical protein [Melittangium boletus]|uniref:hypothetical protein n=1 Tax=Melittangium boletus TaxID=83453 RepID=UPI003DA20509
MNRRLVGLLAALCLLSACSDEPVGQMEPIPRPAGAQAPPPPPPAPTPAPERPDPSKVVLRWNLQEPTAFLATVSGATSGPARSSPAPAPRRGKKGKEAPEKPAEAPASSGREQKILFLLSRTEAGEPTVLLLPQDGSEEDRASMSERGFVLDGLSGQLRNLAVLTLELPADPVGPGAQWRLAANLVDTTGVPGFTPSDSQQKNEVKLVSLTPGDGGEQVATLAYELTQSVSGRLRPEGSHGAGEDEEDEEGHDHGHDHGHDEKDALEVKRLKSTSKAAQKASMSTRKSLKTRTPGTPASAEMRVTGRGEFLVKTGQWRTWEATLTTRTTGGLVLPGAPAGERTVRLSPVKPIPPEALQKRVKK